MKKIFYFILISLCCCTTTVLASETYVARIDDVYYTDLLKAINEAKADDTIVMLSDVTMKNPIDINKVVNINLNNHNILGDNKVFLVVGGDLSLTGKGAVREVNPYFGAVMIKGSPTETEDPYSSLYVGKDVTLEGWSGVFVDQNNQNGYGINVNFNGKISGAPDESGDTGYGIYVNGNIKNKTNYPIINIGEDAVITSPGMGLYLAGYSEVTTTGYIEGVNAGIGMKSGILNVNGGTIYATGADTTPTEDYSDGINPSGTALQIESNDGYAGDMKINITGGSLRSENSHAVYEYTNYNGTSVTEFAISGGTFRSGGEKNVFSLSRQFTTRHQRFITGGSFSTNPTAYLSWYYTTTYNDGLYTVIRRTAGETDTTKTLNVASNKIGTLPLIIIGIVALIALLYFLFKNKVSFIWSINKK